MYWLGFIAAAIGWSSFSRPACVHKVNILGLSYYRIMADIFLSYTSIKDIEGLVKEFHKHLENEVKQKTGDVNNTIFFDQEEIKGGDKWKEILFEELKSARLLIILLSPTWLNSEWCQWEYEKFKEIEGRPIYPILWDEVYTENINSEKGKGIYKDLGDIQIGADWTKFKYKPWSKKKPWAELERIAKEINKKLLESVE